MQGLRGTVDGVLPTSTAQERHAQRWRLIHQPEQRVRAADARDELNSLDATRRCPEPVRTVAEVARKGAWVVGGRDRGREGSLSVGRCSWWRSIAR